MSKKIIDYKLVVEEHEKELNKEVNDLIKAGWTPKGAASIVSLSSIAYTLYYQTMVLVEFD